MIETAIEPVPATTIPMEREVTVIATNAEQMRAAQAILVARTEARLTALEEEAADLSQNLVTAKAHKLRQTTILSALARNKKRITFYEKLKAAFEAGYTLIPDMGVEVFAVRTTRRSPKYEHAKQEHAWKSEPWLHSLESNNPPLGEGSYVSNRPRIMGQDSERLDDKGNKLQVIERWTDGFAEEIVFPFVLAKPQIVEMTTRAMALKIFDDFGVLPAAQRGDPMVVGRINLKLSPTQSRSMNFLVCWFVNTGDI